MGELRARQERADDIHGGKTAASFDGAQQRSHAANSQRRLLAIQILRPVSHFACLFLVFFLNLILI